MPADSEGVMWRTIGTILVVVLFLVGSLVYVGFYGTGYSLLQKIIVVLIALIIAWAVIAICWITWAGKRGYMNPDKWREYAWEKGGRRRR